MKIAHCVNEVLVGGGAIHIHQLLKDFQALGHEAVCITYQDGPVGKMMERDGIRVYLIREPELPQILRHTHPDIVHGHTCGGGSPAIEIAHQLGIKAGETIHSCVPGVNAQADFEVVETRHQLAMRPQATLIRWAFPPERFEPTGRDVRAELGIPADAIVVGRNGRLDGSKAPDVFVEVLAQLPLCWGLMVGNGPEYHSLRQLARLRGCSDRLVMPGMVTEGLGDYFSAMDIICYPTYDESVCAGVHECLYLEKPVICTPVGGMGETIIDRWSGLHAYSPQQMAEQVQYLIDHPDYARQLGQAGRVQLHLNGQDDPVREAELHLQLYQKVLNA